MALIFYSAETGEVRRVVYDDKLTDDYLKTVHLSLADEAVLTIDMKFDGVENFDVQVVQRYVSEVTGLIP